MALVVVAGAAAEVVVIMEVVVVMEEVTVADAQGIFTTAAQRVTDMSAVAAPPTGGGHGIWAGPHGDGPGDGHGLPVVS